MTPRKQHLPSWNLPGLCLTVLLVLQHGCASLPAIDPSGEQIFLPPAAAVQPAYPAPASESGFLQTSFFGGGFWDTEPDYEEPCSLPPEGECNEPGVYGWEPHPLLDHPGLLQDRLFQREPVMGNPLTRAPGGPPVAPPQPLGPPYTVVVPTTPEQGPATVSTGGRPFNTHHAALQLTPQRLVAPVGQAVLLRAGICGIDGYLITEQPIEWSLSTDSVGSIVEVDQTDKRRWQTFWGRPPKKLSGQYALGRTSRETQLLPRGTIGVNDDIWLLRGQTWASITSASEGATHVTVVAPSVAGWNERRKNATIHWVDGQWGFPPPSVGNSASGQTLVTRVSRATSNAPIEGWIVRYEIAGGTPAALDTSGSQAQEVRTNNKGEASVTVLPQGEFSGVTTINMQVIRTGVNPGDLARLPVGQGSTTVTWSTGDASAAAAAPPSLPGQPPAIPAQPPAMPGQPPSLPSAATISVNGPATATVGAVGTYRIRLENMGTAPIERVEITAETPNQLTFQNSSPSPESAGGQPRWVLGPLEPGQPKQITVNYRVSGEGSLRVCASATVNNGLPVTDCITTLVQAAGPPTAPGPAPGPADISLQIAGPSTGTVGATVPFEIRIRNNSNRTVNIPQIRVNFDDGFKHFIGLSPITAPDFGSLRPGELKGYPLQFEIRATGQHCFDVTAIDDGGGETSDRFCVTASVAQPPLNPQPPAGAPPAGGGLAVRMTGPPIVNVNQEFEFIIVVTNLTGNELTNVRVVNGSDPALKPKGVLPEAESYDPQTNELIWQFSSLPAGQSITMRAGFVGQNPMDTACSRTYVQAGGLTGTGEACLQIAAPNPPAPIGVPSPDIRGDARPDVFTPSDPGPDLQPPGDNSNPLDLRPALNVKVRPGIATASHEQDYFFEIHNESGQVKSNVVLSTLLPPAATLVRAEGQPGIARSSPDGSELQFNPIKTLRPNEHVRVQIRVHTGGQSLADPLARVRSE